VAVTARFLADFTSFNAAVSKAEVKLVEFTSGASRVEKALSRMTDSFSGRKILQEATLAAKAVESIGGAAKLTEAEQKRLNATVTEALAKYKALGLEAPKSIKDLEEATRGANTQTEGLGARITGLTAAAAAAALAFREVTRIAIDWVTASNAQEDATVRLNTALRAQGTFTPQLSAQYAALATEFEKTTVFADELVMEMQALLVQIGGVMPENMKAALTATTDLAAGLRIDLSSATMLVAKALEGNSGALKRYGIEVDEVAFKTKGAEAVFDAIAEKMGGQASAQAASFSGQMARIGNVIDNVKETLGGFIANVLKPMIDKFMQLPEPVRNGAVALGLLGAAATALAVAVTGMAAAVSLALPLLGMSPAVAGAGALTGLAAAATAAKVALATFAWPVALTAAGAVGVWEVGKAFKNLWATIRDGGSLWEFFTAKDDDNFIRRWAGLSKSVQEATEQMGFIGPRLNEAQAAAVPFTAQLAALKAEVNGLSKATKDEIVAGKALGISIEDLAKKFGLQEGVIKLVTEKTEKATKADTAAAKAKKELAEWTRNLGDKLGVFNTIQSDTNELFQESVPQVLAYAAAMQEATERVTFIQGEIRQLNGMQVGPLFQEPIEELGEYFEKIDKAGERMRQFADGIKGHLKDIQRSVADNLALMLTGQQSFKDAMLGIWGGIKQGVTRILSDILNEFLGSFLKGMLGGLKSAAGEMGKALGGMLSGLFGGGAQGEGGGIAGIGGQAGGAAAGGQFGGQQIPSIDLLKIGVDLAKAGIKKLGDKLQGGEEGMLVNPARDTYFQQFKAEFGGNEFEGLAKAFADAGVAGDVAERHIAMLYGADTMQEFNAAVATIDKKLADSKKKQESGFEDTTKAAEAMVARIADGFDKLIAKLDEFFARISGVGLAVQTVADSVALLPLAATAAPTLEAPAVDMADLEQFSQGSGGIRNFGRGTLAMLHGREEVRTEAQARADAGGVTITGGINITVTGAGKNAAQIARELGPEIMKQIGRFNVGGSRRQLQVIAGTA
jgi:hypothetical protein